MPRAFLPTLRTPRRDAIVVGATKPHPAADAAANPDLEAKVILSAYYNALTSAGLGTRTGRWDVSRAIAEGYDRCMWTFKCVQARGAAHAGLPFQLRQGKDDVDDHPLMRLLNKKANDLETGPVLRKRLVAQTLLSPTGAFTEMGLARSGTPLRIDLLPPGRTRIIPGRNADPISHFEVTAVDGSRRGVDPERVRWFRDPHPTDPYSGVTPLTSAGLSIELDFYARLYNVSFLKNDGRPGGIIGVSSKSGQRMDTQDLDRLEDRFGKGPAEAGKLTALNGELSYVDPAAKPRDMQYAILAKTAKIEILSAFSTPESVFGYAADRTFSNADAELYAWWTITMRETNDLICSGFDADSEDELSGYMDTSEVEVLQRAAIARRAEAREEVAAGLRSIWSYAQVAGISDEIEETPYTRALWQPTGKTPIPAKASDAEALGLSGPGEDNPATTTDGALEAGAPAEGELPPPAEETPAITGGPQPPAEIGPGPTTPQLPAAPAAAPAGTGGVLGTKVHRDARPNSLTDRMGERRPRPVLRIVRGGAASTGARAPRPRVETKASPPTEDERVSEADARARDRAEDALAAALTALSTRWVNRSAGRLRLPKERKGTRHWQADPAMPTDLRVGVKALDAAGIVDPDLIAQEAEDTARPILEAAAYTAAAMLLADLLADTAIAGFTVARQTTVTDLAATDPRTWPKRLLDSLRSDLDAALAMLRASAHRQAVRLVEDIADADADGGDLGAITAAIQARAAALAGWADGVAVQATTAATEAARASAATEVEDALAEVVEVAAAAAEEATGRALDAEEDGDPGAAAQADAEAAAAAELAAAAARDIRREWVTRRDERVRDTHRDDGEGQVQPIGGLFVIGGALLRFPGDPLAPWSETANCRCYLRYRSRKRGTFVARPAGEQRGNPQGRAV